jgi:hypothetical protein
MSSIIEYMIATSPHLKNLYLIQEEAMAKAQNGLRSVGSLWKGTCKTGTMLSGWIDLGILGRVNIMEFPNTNKKNSTDPDYFISVKFQEKNEDVPLPPKTDDL